MAAGEMRATTMDDLKFSTMKPHLDRWIDGDAMLMTDEFAAYDKLGTASTKVSLSPRGKSGPATVAASISRSAKRHSNPPPTP